MKVRPKKSDYEALYSDSTQAKSINKIIHRSESRGSADHGWLRVNHSFSFAQWYDPEKVNFGALRVLNDDYIAAGKGFGTHPHDNMEIITIPLRGELAHTDSMGNSSTIKAGEIQVMSAGEGVLHSEFNPSSTQETNLFQIWIFPETRDVKPRYDQFWMNEEKMKNNFLQLVSPDPNDEGTFIHQQAWISIAELDENALLKYAFHSPKNGIYAMVIEGKVQIANEELKMRDAIGVTNEIEIDIKAKEKSKILVIEVPMEF